MRPAAAAVFRHIVAGDRAFPPIPRGFRRGRLVGFIGGCDGNATRPFSYGRRSRAMLLPCGRSGRDHRGGEQLLGVDRVQLVMTAAELAIDGDPALFVDDSLDLGVAEHP